MRPHAPSTQRTKGAPRMPRMPFRAALSMVNLNVQYEIDVVAYHPLWTGATSKRGTEALCEGFSPGGDMAAHTIAVMTAAAPTPKEMSARRASVRPGFVRESAQFGEQSSWRWLSSFLARYPKTPPAP